MDHNETEVSLPFGKYRGIPLDQVPKNYLVWCLDTINDLRPALRKAIELEVFGDHQDYEAGKVAGVKLAIDSIKSWHRKEAITHHPDKGGDRKTMALVNVLRDEIVQVLEGVLQ